MRVVCTLLFFGSLLLTPACHGPEPEPAPSMKLSDLAPPGQPKPQVGLLGDMSLDIHIYQLPQKRLRDLKDLWHSTKTRGLRYRNHQTFRANALRAGLTRIQRWNWIDGVLQEVRAQKLRTVSMLITGQESNDLMIRSVNNFAPLSFVNQAGKTEKTKLRPGNFVLRWQVLPQIDGSYRLMGYPALAMTISSRIPELAERMRAQEPEFKETAFSAPLQPGDILILGPETHMGDGSTLGGMVFCDEEVLFVDKIQPDMPRTEPAVRLYILVCAQVKIPLQ